MTVYSDKYIKTELHSGYVHSTDFKMANDLCERIEVTEFQVDTTVPSVNSFLNQNYIMILITQEPSQDSEHP